MTRCSWGIDTGWQGTYNCAQCSNRRRKPIHEFIAYRSIDSSHPDAIRLHERLVKPYLSDAVVKNLGRTNRHGMYRPRTLRHQTALGYTEMTAPFPSRVETCRYSQGFEPERITHVELNRIWKRGVQSCSSSVALPRQLRQASSKRKARFLLEPTPCGKARRKSVPFSIN